MNKTPKANFVVFKNSDLPNFATHATQSECGFSVYRGVLIQWDEDQDERVVTLIDKLPDFVREQLLVVQEHEGILGLIWKGRVPAGYDERHSIEVEDDQWSIHKSVGN
jgi:hypothetical protein